MNCEICSQMFTEMPALIRHVKDSEMHVDSTVGHFSCSLCSMTFHNLDDTVQHMDSEEHSIMCLATGIYFDGPDSLGIPYPPLQFCILCSCRDGKPFKNHLESAAHKKVAWLMRTICRRKKVNYINYSSDSFVSTKSQEFMNKIINMKQQEFLGEAQVTDCSLEFVCVLCNIYFNKSEDYKQHMKNQSHRRMGNFISQISHLVKELDIVGYTSDTKVSETFSNSVPSLYYCDFCCLWIVNSEAYIQHINDFSHKRVEELYSKLSNKRNGKDISLCLESQGCSKLDEVSSSKEYCKLCAVWCVDSNQHLVENTDHAKIEHFIGTLTDESDQKFINVYINAQAHANFGNSPQNYCQTCNILLSKSEKYKQHLESEKHKKIAQKKEKVGSDEKATISVSSSLGKVRRKSVINYSHFYSSIEKHESYKQTKNISLLDYKHQKTEITNSSSRFYFGNSKTDSRHYFGDGTFKGYISSPFHFAEGITHNNFTSRLYFEGSKAELESSSGHHFHNSKTRSNPTFLHFEDSRTMRKGCHEEEGHIKDAKTKSNSPAPHDFENHERKTSSSRHRLVDIKTNIISNRHHLRNSKNKSPSPSLLRLEDRNGKRSSSRHRSDKIKTNISSNRCHLRNSKNKSSSPSLPHLKDSKRKRSSSRHRSDEIKTNKTHPRRPLKDSKTKKNSVSPFNFGDVKKISSQYCLKEGNTKRILPPRRHLRNSKTKSKSLSPFRFKKKRNFSPYRIKDDKTKRSPRRHSRNDKTEKHSSPLHFENGKKERNASRHRFGYDEIKKILSPRRHLKDGETENHSPSPFHFENDKNNSSFHRLENGKTERSLSPRRRNNSLRPISPLHFKTKRVLSPRRHLRDGKTKNRSPSPFHFANGKRNSSPSRLGNGKTKSVFSPRRHSRDNKSVSPSSPLHLRNGKSKSNYSKPRFGFRKIENNHMLQLEKDNADSDSSSAKFYCELCNFLSTNGHHYHKHLIGENHKRMRRMLNKKEKKFDLDAMEYEISSRSHLLQYNCELCDVFNYDSQEYEDHLESAKHKQNQWFLYILMQKPLSV